MSATDLGVISDYYTYAVNDLGGADQVPYLPSTIGAIDNLYYLANSGDKFISPYLKRLLSYEYPSPTGWRVVVARDLYYMLHAQLMKEWAAFVAEYDPAAPYHITETVDYDHEAGNEYTDSGSDTRKTKGVIQQFGESKSENTAWTYENSSQKTSEVKTSSDETVNPLTTRYGTGVDDNGLDNITTYGKTRTGEESGHDDLTTEKYGNLGISPIAQSLQLDIELWKMNFYQTIMFPLFDKVLTLPIY